MKNNVRLSLADLAVLEGLLNEYFEVSGSAGMTEKGVRKLIRIRDRIRDAANKKAFPSYADAFKKTTTPVKEVKRIVELKRESIDKVESRIAAELAEAEKKTKAWLNNREK